MKQKNQLDELLFELSQEVANAPTPEGHQQRFLSKLHAEQPTKNKVHWWRTLSVAASLAILIIAGTFVVNPKETQYDLASISPEMEKTQNFFTTTINRELATLKSFEAPQAKALVADALQQLEILETQYEALRDDLQNSGSDKRVIYAMISNLQSRVDLLMEVINKIEEVEQLNTNNNDTKI